MQHLFPASCHSIPRAPLFLLLFGDLVHRCRIKNPLAGAAGAIKDPTASSSVPGFRAELVLMGRMNLSGLPSEFSSSPELLSFGIVMNLGAGASSLLWNSLSLVWFCIFFCLCHWFKSFSLCTIGLLSLSPSSFSSDGLRISRLCYPRPLHAQCVARSCGRHLSEILSYTPCQGTMGVGRKNLKRESHGAGGFSLQENQSIMQVVSLRGSNIIEVHSHPGLSHLWLLNRWISVKSIFSS